LQLLDFEVRDTQHVPMKSTSNCGFIHLLSKKLAVRDRFQKTSRPPQMSDCKILKIKGFKLFEIQLNAVVALKCYDSISPTMLLDIFRFGGLEAPLLGNR